MIYMENNTIKVTGTATVKVKPDTYRLTVKVERVLPTYDEAYEEGKKALLVINSTLSGSGLEESLAKTHRFDVTEHSKPRYVRNHYEGRVKDGYELHLRVTVDIDIENNLANDILKGFGTAIPFVETDIDAVISNPRAARMKALAYAVADAKEKAGIIASSIGVELGDVCKVVYGNDESGIVSYADGCCYGSAMGAELSMTAAEEELEESVEAYWYIKR